MRTSILRGAATRSTALMSAAVLSTTLLLTTLLLTACGGGSPEAAPVPDDWQTFTAGRVVVKAPPTWRKLDAPSAGDGTTTTTFGLPDDGSMVRPGVSVTSVPHPDRDAADEASALVTREKATNGAKDVTTTEVERAGATSAVEVTFWQELRSAEGPVEVAHHWLVADLDDGSQVLVGALGARADFEELPLDEAIAAVDLRGGDS
ncbi:hypothetical protein ET495_09820 [Xylanimonas allomyrinae]|uniref:DUF1795 domain-containing protein n=1 Tax=Xylanimonas allomyrinae TaxID=2509459 RepID=A0A4V0YEA2_9MICO|nr:hypothetical protein [Xylanimonas allomyrinae]QAY63501.1 hypothetical protein ET495_09820 [Xylanimonas allomyrinae]